MNHLNKLNAMIFKLVAITIVCTSLQSMAQSEETTTLCGIKNIPWNSITIEPESISLSEVANNEIFQSNDGRYPLSVIKTCLSDNNLYLVVQFKNSVEAFSWSIIPMNNSKKLQFSLDEMATVIAEYAEYNPEKVEFNDKKIKAIKNCQSLKEILFLDLLQDPTLASERTKVVNCLLKKRS